MSALTLKKLISCSSLSFLVILFFVRCQSGPKVNVILFDGQTMNAWEAWTPETGRIAPDSVYQVSDKMIRMVGTDNGGYLISKESFENFELTLSYRWNPDAVENRTHPLNSGVMYRVPDKAPDSWFPKGIQFQIKEGSTGDFILLKEATMKIAGKVYGPGQSVLVPSNKLYGGALGEWNQLRVVAIGGHIKQFLNGKLICEGTDCSVLSGHILLCYERSPIDFKDIILSKLN